FEARIKGDLHIEFGDEKLTSFAGLELVRRFLRDVEFFAELRRSSTRAAVGGDVSFGKVVLLVLGMLVAGAKRLRHLGFLRDDPMFLRFAGLSKAPTDRSLGRALQRMKYRTWPELDRLSLLVARASLENIDAQRWTLDFDGSVLTTGLQVERAERGFNPHHRKNPSYYPIVCTLAQTGHVIGHMNRRGNVHDSHRSAEFLRETVRDAREEINLSGLFEVRTDSAFFQRDFLATCDRLHVEYAVKVPMWPWLNLRGIVKKKNERDWEWVDRKNGLQGLFAELPIAPWGRTERIAIYRKSINHEPVKGRQLELFNPDDGFWEYSVVATNKTLGLRALWHFQAGRGVQEKTIGELKSGFAFGSIPTHSYAANTAWQKLNILAHNLVTSFQLATTATKKPRTAKRTTLFLLRSVATLRFEWLGRAARLVRPNGSPTLRLVENRATRAVVEKIEKALAVA
ncbi:MAG TPA: IS1380 family transposase, partial [Burkholderiales bacterium]|nr:IS1380 family transposase [Burkholderiales bacterium]